MTVKHAALTLNKQKLYIKQQKTHFQPTKYLPKSQKQKLSLQIPT